MKPKGRSLRSEIGWAAQAGVRTIQYIYDFGDDWDHSVRIERVNDATPGVIYPRLLKATGACPPEDVGGAWGYEEFLEALADPVHEQHDDMVAGRVARLILTMLRPTG